LKTRTISFKPFAVFAASVLLASAAVMIRSALVGGNLDARSSGEGDFDWEAYTSGVQHEWDDFERMHDIDGLEETDFVGSGSENLSRTPGVGPYGPPSLLSAASPKLVGAIGPHYGHGSAGGGFSSHGHACAVSRYLHGSYYPYRWRYEYLKWYLRRYYKQYMESRRTTRWPVAGSTGEYFVFSPGGFGVQGAPGGGWRWRVETAGDDLPAGDPVETQGSVSVVFVSPRKGVLEGSPLHVATFDKRSGDLVLDMTLHPGVESIEVEEDEEEGSVTVRTCYGGAVPCEETGAFL
jgi:hypothetical protein